MPPKRPRRTRPSPPAHEAPTTAPPRAPAEVAAPTRDQLPAGYAAFLADVLARVRAAHLRTAVAVNRGLVALYWELGREIVTRQARNGWGAEIVNRLADDLRREFPATRGFTRRNLYYGRAFYLGYAPRASPAGATPSVKSPAALPAARFRSAPARPGCRRNRR